MTGPCPSHGPLSLGIKSPGIAECHVFKFFINRRAISPNTPVMQPMNSQPMTFRPLEWATVAVTATLANQINGSILPSFINWTCECAQPIEVECASQENRNTNGGGAVSALSSSVQSEGGRAYQMPSILPVELGRVADAMRPFFRGVAHVV